MYHQLNSVRLKIMLNDYRLISSPLSEFPFWQIENSNPLARTAETQYWELIDDPASVFRRIKKVPLSFGKPIRLNPNSAPKH